MGRANDQGLRNIVDALKNADGKVIEAGIFSDAKASRSKSGSIADNLAIRYQIHDEGTSRIPQRETLQPATEVFIRQYNQGRFDHHFSKLDQDGMRGLSKRANAAGQRLAAQIKLSMTQLKVPAKKEATIRAAQQRYGGSRRNNPLIQTGEMRAAVSSRFR